MNWKIWSLLILVSLAAVGCGPAGLHPDAPRPVARIDAIELRAMPTAVNWDDDPGPDGLRAEVYCYRVDQPEPMPIEGVLEFVLYEGRLRRSELAAAEPILIWRFTDRELSQMLVRRMGLWGYAVQLGWGDRVPQSASVTLVARHRSPEDGLVQSAPISISMGAR